MKLQEQTTSAQNNLGIYCRTGKIREIPGINKNRIHHYRRLVFNVVKNTMKQAYPLTLQVMGEEKFTALVHDFFSNHKAQTPQIWKLPNEFYEYALESDFRKKTGKLWLNDLLLFEWIEIEVHTMPDIVSPEFNETGNIMEDILITNPESRLIQLNYPVHIMNVVDAEKNEGNYFVLVSRQKNTGNVNFFNLSLFHAWVYEKITTEKLSVKKLIPQVKVMFGFENEKKLISNLSHFISDLKNKQAILGFVN